MALGRNHRIFNIGNSSGSYGISRVYHDETLSGDGTLSSLLGVVGGAGDAEVNEFVYNNSGDIINVDNVVQTNSANWNDISAYQENSGSYQPSGNYIPYTAAFDDTFKTNSALWFQRPNGDTQSNYINYNTIQLRNVIDVSAQTGAILTYNFLRFETYSDSAYVDKDKIHKWDNVSDYTQNNSANWNEVSSKLDASAFDPNEFYPMTGNPSGFLTAHQDISNKLDVSAFSDVSGTFLTAVPAGYATTGEVNSVSSILSAAIDAQSGNVYTGIDPIVVNNDDKAISANTWAFSAGNGISFVDDNVNKITRIDVTAAGGNPEVESYVVNNSATIDDVNTTYQTNSGSYLTAHQSLDGYATTSELNSISSYFSGAIDYVSANAGGGSTYSAGNGIDITDDTISVDTAVIPDISAVSAMIDAASANGNLFIAEYGETTRQEVDNAYNAGKYIVCHWSSNYVYIPLTEIYDNVYRFNSPFIVRFNKYTPYCAKANGSIYLDSTWHYESFPANADWNETNTNSRGYIANKPNLSEYLTTATFDTISGDWNEAITAYQTNSSTYLTAVDLSNYVPVSAYNELKSSYDTLSSLFATYSGQWLLPNTGV